MIDLIVKFGGLNCNFCTNFKHTPIFSVFSMLILLYSILFIDNKYNWLLTLQTKDSIDENKSQGEKKKNTTPLFNAV